MISIIKTSRQLLSAAIGAVLLCVMPAVVAETQAAEVSPTIELGAPFCDNMILQRDMKVPVWGWSKPGDTITVDFAAQKKTGKSR